MKNEDFNELVEQCVDILKKSLTSKGKEYAGDNDDRFINFKRGGEIRRTTPEDALMWYYVKHIASIIEIVDQITKENKKIGLNFIYRPNDEIPWKIIEEKIKDLVNYPILLKGILKERYYYG